MKVNIARARELKSGVDYREGDFTRTRELMRAIDYLDGGFYAGTGTNESDWLP
ncbi:hypothetical protein [Heyndrickxia oleronia]|uniref:Uncharacterized protein n=1 Tax=Heyndrickxia oleronia TaxID=38875 RepID=A0AAW6T4Y1_9BACI|nr:hypothetical protein [Heyndrickxia oleronia]MDH5164354.1 hypothetical protein [Heyndrickxia oleronia]